MKLQRPIRWAGLVYVILCICPNAGAQSTVGPITAENQRPGTRDWLLTKVDTSRAFIHAFGEQSPYFARSTRVEGFASRMSYAAGDTVTLFVNTDPPAGFTLDVFRMGYYAGDGARKMMSTGPHEGTPQPTPDDGERNLREARWQPSVTFVIPEDWLSGVYLGKLTELAEDHQAYVVFVVKDSRRADVMVQASDLTWQAYNRWPAWRSLYDYRDQIWNTVGGNILSLNRPYTFYYNGLPSDLNPMTNGSGEFLLWEFPLTFWLEKEGYDVTYVSNVDTHENPDGLLRVKGFLSVGHDEYWTRDMYDHVTSARDAGVNLLFLGGNSVDGEIFLTTSTDGRPNRIMGRIRNFPDEQTLMGAASYGVGLGDWTVRKAGHWVFDDTGLENGDVIPDLVGWEYHGPPLRDDPTLVVLAESVLDEEWGSEPDTYSTTIYTAARDNFVFNAATCWWSLPLSSPPGVWNPPNKDFSADDARVQQIMRNLLSRAIGSDWPARQ